MSWLKKPFSSSRFLLGKIRASGTITDGNDTGKTTVAVGRRHGDQGRERRHQQQTLAWNQRCLGGAPHPHESPLLGGAPAPLHASPFLAHSKHSVNACGVQPSPPPGPQEADVLLEHFGSQGLGLIVRGQSPGRVSSPSKWKMATNCNFSSLAVVPSG